MGMKAVETQMASNVAVASGFFRTLTESVVKYIQDVSGGGKITNTVEVCQHFLLLAPVSKVVKAYVGERREREA